MCQGLSPDRQPHLADGELWLRDAQKLGQGRRADNGQNCDEDRVCLTTKPLPCLECLWPHVGPAFIRCLQPPSFKHLSEANTSLSLDTPLQNCMGLSTPLQQCRLNFFPFFSSDCISLISSDVEHLLVCLLALGEMSIALF